MPRFFIPQEYIKGNAAYLPGAERHHLEHVLRLKPGDRIEFFDGRGRSYQGRISEMAGKKVKVQIEQVTKPQKGGLLESGLKISLFQALPKRNKMDYIVEKSTELGVHSLIPLETARTIVRLDKNKSALRRERWQRIAREAAKQCARTTIPQVMDLTAWPDALSSLALGDFDLKLFFCLSEKAKKIKGLLRQKAGLRKVALFIGPEGDFTPQEIEEAQQAGCIAASLGKDVLKTDTAPIAALAIVNYELRQ